MTDSVVDLCLPGIGPCVRIIHAPEVTAAFNAALAGCSVSFTPPHNEAPPFYIKKDKEGLWQGEWTSRDEFYIPSATSAVCSVVGELMGRYLAQQPEILGLHCAAVEIAGRLILFPEDSRAGKSTLSAAFMAAGYKVFGDDVLGLTAQGEGIAMGVAPRLRLPLPATFSAEFLDYLNDSLRLSDERYGFVLPSESRLAQHAERAPVGAIVLLERSHDELAQAEPDLIRLSAGEGLLQLLCQNFAYEASGEELITFLMPLMQRTPCYLLRYSEPLAAARYLADQLKQPTSIVQAASLLSYPPNEQNEVEQNLTPDTVWQPVQNVSLYELDDDLFLIHADTGVIHRLNSTAKAVWQLLQQEPLSGLEISEVLAEYFEIGLARVQRDILPLLAALAQAELITQTRNEQ
ncbi:PqqD family peptide modification chaperone [Paenalcaligenes hominis]|uniref:PqqD family peptide modification chaperone n=1 Tax=Paenalcaligenes hominis TaxID=643674 RepID=UPI0035247649